MKYIKILMLFAVVTFTYSCSKDDLSSDSIFDTTPPARTEFDQWLMNNYITPYNIDFKYLYNDKLTDNYYNLVPAGIENSKAMAILLKHVWLDAYTEIAGVDFIKENTFRVIQLIGSPEYNSQGSIVLGTAEGGIQISLFRINELDLDNIYVNQDNPYRLQSELPLDLNYWYFHTMHHEFCHILTQKKNYSTDFQAISAGKYHSADWVNVEDVDAPLEGFVSGYASGEYNEDFAEVFSKYVTTTQTAWEEILDHGVDYDDIIDYDDDDNPIYNTSGKDAILAKLEIVKAYMQDSWGIDLDTLRAAVLRRSAEAATLDLKTLK